MQTFLPYSDYFKSMECLDYSRLGNQVWREGIILIRGGWENHPASKMWKGYEYHLGLYLLSGLKILRIRNKKEYNNVEFNIRNEMLRFENTGAPKWLGNENFHASHRSNLLRKANEALEKSMNASTNKMMLKYMYIYKWYQQFNWLESPDLPYFWPTKEGY